MRNFGQDIFHESVYMPINDNFLAAVRTIFMNGLKMCAVPVVFFSIAASASDLGSFSGLRRTGMRLLRWFLVMQVIAVIIGFGIVGLLGTGKGAGFIVQSASSSSAKSVSFIDTLVHLIPENIDRSFVEGNMLQLIVVAFLAGAAAASTGAKIVIQAFNELNRLYMKITAYFMKFMPLLIFCFITSTIITTGLNTILSVAGLLVTLWAGYLLMNAACCLAVKFLTGLNPAHAYRKSLPALITGFTTCSSNACLPDLMKSAESLGISPKLYSFSLPLGISINKITNCVYFAACVLSAAYMYGINISWSGIMSAGISAVIINMATPGILGALTAEKEKLLDIETYNRS